MIRGTTAPFKFVVPYAFQEITRIEAVFWQKHHKGTDEAPLPIEKIYNGLENGRNDGFAAPTLESKEVHTTLTPEETFRFSENEKGYAQVKVFYADRNLIVSSKEQKFTVYPSHNDDPIIVDPPEVMDDLYVFDAGAI